ncbi:MAG: LysR family transcriptional regulator [Actinomycetota bacterium]|nr:LysR family transcriptional regulator [Actinomycetota bacterium]
MDSLRDLEIRHLIALDAVATTGTFGRAALALGYTQSAISQQIASFERLIGAALFDRHGGPRPVTLTPLGERLLDHARVLLERVEATSRDLDEFQHGASGQLRIGTFESISTGLLPQIVGRLLNERPQLDIELVEAFEDDKLVTWLRAGTTDVSFFVGDNGEPGEFETVHLKSDPYVVVARADNVGDGPVMADDLVGVPLIGEHGGSCQDRVDEGLQAMGVQPRYVFRSRGNGAVLAMVRAGMGMAVMARMAIDRDDPELSIRALDPPITPRDIRLAWRAGRTLSPVAQRLVDIALEVCDQVPAATARAS